MALLVILIGALLILGGGSSLLAGFDITATERGSAMTIAGTVALTGGVIAVAIGFSLLRLSQILNVLQTNVEEEAVDGAALSPKTSAVSHAEIETIVPPATASETVRPIGTPRAEIEDTILTSPLKPRETIKSPKKSGFFKRSTTSPETSPAPSTQNLEAISSSSKTATGLATAGLATAGLAGAAILASSNASAHDSKAELPIDLDLDLDSFLEAAPAEVLENITEPPEAELSADLEAELSRALAEDIPSINTSNLDNGAEPTQDASSAEMEREPVSFNEGLTNILSKPKKRGKKQATSAEPSSDTDFQDEFIENTALSQNDDSNLNASEDVESANHEVTVDDVSEDTHESAVAEMSNFTSEPTEERPTILGTYNAGNGTYVMYSDGTVEAIMEQGIRKFKSMEELRNHLAQA